MVLLAERQPLSIKVKDEVFPHNQIVEHLLELSSASLTARELISERVRMECDRLQLAENGRGVTPLVQPTEAEQLLNQKELKAKPSLEKQLAMQEKQIDIALRAFLDNGFILLINDVQIGDLDQLVELNPDTDVTFLRLTPLVGG